jgi:hypothetical protein
MSNELRHRSHCAIVAEGYPTCTCTVTYWRQQVAGGLVSAADAAERLEGMEGMEAFLAEVDGRQSWGDLAGVVDDLRGDWDGEG